MKHNIQIFENETFGNIRTTVTKDGNILFCLLDVAKALGYSNPAKAVRIHCKGETVLETLTQNQHNATVIQNMKFGKEGNVYRLAMKSKLPDAEKFQDWICDEVLPEIRKTGSYNQSGSYKVAYPYTKKIGRLERLREIDRDRMELMQKWILNLQEECSIYSQQMKACIGTICTRNFSESENMQQLGKLMKSIRFERNISPSQLISIAEIELSSTSLTNFEKGEGDISLSYFLKLLSALDCSLQIIRNED